MLIPEDGERLFIPLSSNLAGFGRADAKFSKK
jgi:hypothetical protein